VGKFVVYLLRGTYFFDVHPPLAKLIYAATGEKCLLHATAAAACQLRMLCIMLKSLKQMWHIVEQVVRGCDCGKWHTKQHRWYFKISFCYFQE
jgi:hypothetical protein